jgi:DHA3 family macrolide efflux protein-like MFS transporter
MIAAPVVSGALMTLSTIAAIFWIDVVTRPPPCSSWFSGFAPRRENAAACEESGYFRDLRDGVRYIKNHAFVRTFFLFLPGFLFLVAPVAFLTPLGAARTWGGEVWRLTAIEIAFSGGMLLGGALMASWGGFANRTRTMTAAFMCSGLCTLALGLSRSFGVYLFFMTLAGVMLPIFNTPSTVMLQENVEDAFLGRVFGVMSMITSGVMPLGMLVFGPAADVIRIEWMLDATGLAMFALGFWMANSRVLIEAGKPRA